jgi:hypothetical protein
MANPKKAGERRRDFIEYSLPSAIDRAHSTREIHLPQVYSNTMACWPEFLLLRQMT